MDEKSTRYCLTTISMFNSSDQFYFLGLILHCFHIFYIMQQVGDYGFFNWVDNEMSSYEKRMLQRLNDDEQQSRAEVRKLKQKVDIILQRLKDVEKLSWEEVRRVEQKLDTELAKYKIDVEKKCIKLSCL